MIDPILLLFLFFFIALAVFTAFTTYTTRNPIYSLLSLIFTFIFSGLFLITLGQDFLGIILIIVYVGAITVLLLFVIMTLNIRRYDTQLTSESNLGRLLIFLLFLLFFMFGSSLIYQALDNTELYNILGKAHPFTRTHHYDSIPGLIMREDNIQAIGNHLYTTHVVLFIFAGLILFIVMIGALIIAQGDKTNFKKQRSFEQLRRNPDKSTTVHKNK
jgi:NADH-quinone oxidoreductase subunit J